MRDIKHLYFDKRIFGAVIIRKLWNYFRFVISFIFLFLIIPSYSSIITVYFIYKNEKLSWSSLPKIAKGIESLTQTLIL